jgi:hypothetical protein
VALLVLLLLSLLVTTVMQGSVLQLRMARNLETAVTERQEALGEIERILQHLGPEAPVGHPGYIHCTDDYAGEDCDDRSLPGSEVVAAASRVYLRVLKTDMSPPRVVEDNASSGLAYRAMQYEIGAQSGRTSLVQGVVVLVPELHQ